MNDQHTTQHDAGQARRTSAADAAPAQSASNATGTGEPRSRKLMLALLGLAIVGSAAAYGTYYMTTGRYHVATDDAYVNGNLVQLTPQVSGTVVSVNADDTQIVRQGDPVVTLDAADAKIALASAEATLGQTVRQVATLYVNNDFYAATVAQREADLARANADLKRRVDVSDTGAVSAEDIAHARDAVNVAQAALDAARQQAQSNHALTDRTSVADHPSVQAAATRVRDAYLNYARDTLPSPVTGYVARRSVQVGQRVSPGTPLMAIVPLNEVWVDANFKEVQLQHVRIGQPVIMTADVYGSHIKYHGRVVGFSAGTGSAFALLPAQNATGNWIKVVQRLPTRIALDPRELAEHPLRVGLSMEVDVETRDDRGSRLDAATANTTYRTDVFAQFGAQAEAEVARIIAANTDAGGAGGAAPVAKNAGKERVAATTPGAKHGAGRG
ncbi:MAG TPA: HlyD family efflux transporter periplasmic adaptor subunit [Pararobbsia sp.]|nr:HlyD family efflux transporter periplasmic adaptor subunit [Pararobbsia sp.]